MKTRKLAWLIIFALLTVSMMAFTPDEARRVYNEASHSHSKDKPLHEEIGDYIFIFVTWKNDENDSTEKREEKELSAIFDAIEGYLSSPKKEVQTVSPFEDKLTAWLIPAPVFKLPNVVSSVVKEEEHEGVIQKIIAFDAKEMKAAKAACAEAVPDISHWTKNDWLKALVSAKNHFKTAEEKQAFYTMLGCPIVNLILPETGSFKSCEDTNPSVLEINNLLKWTPKMGSVFYEHPALLWSFYKNKGQGFFFPEWSDDDEGAFDEAEGLYLKGKDIPKIISLLVKSISKNPVGAKKWEYLGGVLKVSGKYEDAVIAYLQSLRFDNKSPWAWKGLMESCDKAGLTYNAKGLDWFLCMNGIIK